MGNARGEDGKENAKAPGKSKRKAKGMDKSDTKILFQYSKHVTERFQPELSIAHLTVNAHKLLQAHGIGCLVQSSLPLLMRNPGPHWRGVH